MIAVSVVVATVFVAWIVMRPHPVAVEVVTVATPGAARGALTAGGYVRHARVVNVIPRVAGLVESLRVAEGDVVRAGDLLATIERRELSQQVAEARADLDLAESRLAELEAGARREELAAARARLDAAQLTTSHLEREAARGEALATAGSVSSQAVEAARTNSLVANQRLEEARQSLALLEAGPRPQAITAARAAVRAAAARLARASEQLDRTEVRAPFAGRILRKFVDEGAVASFGTPFTEGYATLGAGTPIVALGALEGLEAVADINQADLGRLSQQQAVDVQADAFPAKHYAARLARFAPRADRNKSTIEVTVRFDDPAPAELVHDMSVKLTFVAEAQGRGPEVPAVPAAALVTRAGAQSVFVVEEGRARARPVVAGPPLPTGVVPIERGLAPGDVVVVTGVASLEDGVAVVPAASTHQGGTQP